MSYEVPQEMGSDWLLFRAKGTVRAKYLAESDTYAVVHGDGTVDVLSNEEFSENYVPVSAAKADTNFRY